MTLQPLPLLRLSLLSSAAIVLLIVVGHERVDAFVNSLSFIPANTPNDCVSSRRRLNLFLSDASASGGTASSSSDDSNNAEDSSSSSPSELINLGVSSLQNGESQEAILYFRIAIEKDPNNAAMLLHLGTIFRNMGSEYLVEAERTLQKAVELFEVRFGTKLSSISSSSSSSTTNENSNSGRQIMEARYQYGVVLDLMGKVDEAVDAFRSVIDRASPSEALPAKVALANVLLDGRDQKKEALDVFRDACTDGEGKRSPSPVSMLAGIASASLEEYDAAEKYFNDAVLFDSGNAEAAFHIMMSLFRNGNSSDGGGSSSSVTMDLERAADRMFALG